MSGCWQTSSSPGRSSPRERCLRSTDRMPCDTVPTRWYGFAASPPGALWWRGNWWLPAPELKSQRTPDKCFGVIPCTPRCSWAAGKVGWYTRLFLMHRTALGSPRANGWGATRLGCAHRRGRHTKAGPSGLWGPYAWEFGVRGGLLAWHLIHHQFRATGSGGTCITVHG